MKGKSGFTLIELMIVVVILAILAATVMPKFAGRAKQARKSRASLDIKNISMALEMYELDNGFFPSTDQSLNALRTKPSSSPVPTNWSEKGYLSTKPIDPWGNEYKYASPGTHNNDFDLYSFGPDVNEGTEDDITNWDVEED